MPVSCPPPTSIPTPVVPLAALHCTPNHLQSPAALSTRLPRSRARAPCSHACPAARPSSSAYLRPCSCPARAAAQLHLRDRPAPLLPHGRDRRQGRSQRRRLSSAARTRRRSGTAQTQRRSGAARMQRRSSATRTRHSGPSAEARRRGRARGRSP
jgi:hypothetical protein